MPEWGNIDDLIEVSPKFLPKPAELVFRPKLKKVTLVLDQESIDFFKAKAGQFDTSYQRMIRTLLSEYTRRMKYSS